MPAVMQNADLLKQRLDDATSTDNKWNNWPDQLEVVGLKVYDQFDPHEMFAIGRLLGQAKVHRQISYAVFSHQAAGYDNEDKPLVEIRKRLPRPRAAHYSDTTLIPFDFVFLAPAGQEDDINRRNIHAIARPTTHHNGLMQREEFISHGLVITIGCKHDLEDAGSNHNRGDHRYKCRKCGWTYRVDSSG
jgi:hypothetical protein